MGVRGHSLLNILLFGITESLKRGGHAELSFSK